jgi:predicted HAD superfamily Cof-like phosphohydrolase
MDMTNTEPKGGTQVMFPSDLEAQVLQFMKAAGQLGEMGFPQFYTELRRNRWDMLMGAEGELTEYSKAEAMDNLPEVVDGLIDMLWVTLGTLYTYVGPECTRDLMNDVARANLSKVDGSIAPVEINDKGKVMKPKGWVGPNTEGILSNHGWKLDENGTPIK